MCGIIGFIGKKKATPFILDGLRNLEYRGYDSAGISIKNDDSILTFKEVGELNNLEKILSNNINGNIGIGHTRWATHGEINQVNSHPHLSMNGNISIVHNGIIENYIELKNGLEKLGYTHKSTTDSEVVANLIEYYLKIDNDLLQAVFKAKRKLIGSYALAIIDKNNDMIIGVKNKSPLCVGIISSEDVMFSSDPSSISKYTNQFIFFNDGEVITLKRKNDNIDINLFVNEINSTYSISNLDIEKDEGDLKGYSSFMLKEIEEQPEIINNLLNYYLKDNIFIKEKEIISILNSNIKDILIVACGTSYFAGELCLSLLKKHSKVNTFTCLASEFSPYAHRINKNSVIITISQSGETADTISALKLVKSKNAKIISITNSKYSTIASLSDLNLDIKAKKERSVASTKAFTSSSVLLYLAFLSFLKSQNEITLIQYQQYIKNLNQITKTSALIINQLKPQIEYISKILSKKDKTMFLGKYDNYVVAKEGALKLKEITYIYSEAIPAGELKHGPLALIEKDFPIVTIFNNNKKESNSYFEIDENKIISNILETKARGALNINITNIKTATVENTGTYNIYLNTDSEISFSLNAVIVLQYLSYFTASLKGLNIDKPRNLAKSVTVE